MGMKDWFKKKTPEPEPVPEPVVVPKVKKPRKKKISVEPVVVAENPAKLAATARGEPWVSVISIDLDLDNIGSGAFDLDWNDIFVAKLIRAGYIGKTDSDVVDQWFNTVCRNVLAENWEQEQADPTNRQR